MDEIIKKLSGLRSELWHKLHDMQEWGAKDRIIEHLKKIKEELEKL